jgi:hypothetical protein
MHDKGHTCGINDLQEWMAHSKVVCRGSKSENFPPRGVMFHPQVTYHLPKGVMSHQNVPNHHEKVEHPIQRCHFISKKVLGHINKGAISSKGPTFSKEVERPIKSRWDVPHKVCKYPLNILQRTKAHSKSIAMQSTSSKEGAHVTKYIKLEACTQVQYNIRSESCQM